MFISKISILFILLISASIVYSSTLKVMNFNTMCDLCGDKEDYGRFKERLESMSDTINRHDPDLISLQEFRTKQQVLKRLIGRLDSAYHTVFARETILSYMDPTLMIKKNRFEVLRTKSIWLGPLAPHFSFGWSIKIPRMAQLAFLKDKKTQKEFLFVGAHFDNSEENKFKSAQYLNQYLKQFSLPILFAGDTNIKTVHKGYSYLLDGLFKDTFMGEEQTIFYANGAFSSKDACNLSKAPTFPLCRIDHVLLSHNAPWSVVSWGVDVYRYRGKIGFVSDHRAVIVVLKQH